MESADEIDITVSGKKTGNKITLPIWFVKEGDKMVFLPVKGSKSHWFRNLQSIPTLTVSAGGRSVNVRALISKDSAKVKDALGKFQKKYGAGDMRRYYSRFDVCVEVVLPKRGNR